MNLVVVTPHFEPDAAPTGEVVTNVVHELARRDHSLEVITSLPWYREHKVEPGYEGKLIRYEDAPWGRITRVHPFPASDKRNIARRGASYTAFSLMTAILGARGRPADGVLTLSPPLTLGLTGWAVATARKAPLVLNVQDVFPDVAIELGVLKNQSVISAARRLERLCYKLADAITVLSDDMKENVSDKLDDADKVQVIPNFVDAEWIKPSERENAYRKEFDLDGKFVVMYAGNVGLSQSLDLMIDAAAALSHEDGVMFVINGDGAGRPALERRARGLSNLRFVDMQPVERMPEIMAAGDVQVVALKQGLARSSVPSKTYKILAAGRPLLASVDRGSEVARVVERFGVGIAVPPEDSEAFTKAVRAFIDAPEEAARMGHAGRAFVERWASPSAVAERYESLFTDLRRRSPRRVDERP